MTWPSTRQGMTSTLLTILPGHEARRGRVRLPRVTTRSGAESAAPGQAATARATRAQAKASATTARGVPASVFVCSLHDLKLQTPGLRPGLRARFCLPARRNAVLGPSPARSRPAATVGLPPGMESPDRAEQFIPAGLASLGIEADETDLAVISAAHGDVLAFDPGPACARPRASSSRSAIRTSRGRRSERERARPFTARPGGGDRRRRGRSRRAARRRASANRAAQPGDQRRRRDLPGALAGDARGGARRAAARRARRDQGRVAVALAGAALRRGGNDGQDRAQRVRPLPGAARRRRGDRRRRQHARAGREQHRQHLRLRPGPQPVGHRALPGRLLERARPPRSPPGSSPARSAPTGSARSASPPPTAG